MKKTSLILTIAIALLLSTFMTGCGTDAEDVNSLHEGEDNVESLYKELVGTYDLFKAEITYVGQPKLILEPPKVVGSMAISSNQKITQKLQVLGTAVFITNTFEILPDEGVMLLKNEDVTAKATYTWDGEILTTTVDTGLYVEKDFWRKLNNSVIELQPPEPQLPIGEPQPPPSAAFVSANPPSGSKIAANSVITLIFDNRPGEVTVSSGIVFGSGRTRSVVGPFPHGPLALTVTWADGSVTLTYIVVARDNDAPEVTGGTIKDGDENVDPAAINNDGRIVITFSEEVSGNIALQTEGGDDVGWLGKVEGNEAALELVKGREIGNETTYVLRGKIADAAGNETEISITFTTRGKE